MLFSVKKGKLEIGGYDDNHIYRICETFAPNDVKGLAKFFAKYRIKMIDNVYALSINEPVKGNMPGIDVLKWIHDAQDLVNVFSKLKNKKYSDISVEEHMRNLDRVLNRRKRNHK